MKGVPCEVKVFIPYATGFDRSHHLFICCDWIFVLASRELEGELQNPVLPAFDDIRKSLQAESGVSRYIISDAENDSSWVPEELIKRNTVGTSIRFITELVEVQ